MERSCSDSTTLGGLGLAALLGGEGFFVEALAEVGGLEDLDLLDAEEGFGEVAYAGVGVVEEVADVLDHGLPHFFLGNARSRASAMRSRLSAVFFSVLLAGREMSPQPVRMRAARIARRRIGVSGKVAGGGFPPPAQRLMETENPTRHPKGELPEGVGSLFCRGPHYRGLFGRGDREGKGPLDPGRTPVVSPHPIPASSGGKDRVRRAGTSPAGG